MLKTIFSYLSYPIQKATPIEPITLSGKFYIYYSYLSSYTLSFSHSTFTLSPSFISVSSPNISVHSFPTSTSLISFTSTSNSKCLFWEFDGNYYLFVFNLKNDLSFPGLHITKSKKVYYIDSIIPLELLNSSMNNNDDENIVYSSQPGDLLEFDKSTDKFFLAARATNLEIISMDDEYYISVDRIMTKITTQAKLVFLDEEMYIMFLARSEMFNEDIGYCYCFDSMKDYQVIKNIIKQYTHRGNEDINEKKEESKVLNVSSVQGKLFDRTFVLQENDIVSVFKSKDKSSINQISAIPLSSSFISDIAIFNEETSLLLLDSSSTTSPIIHQDILSNKVIETWDTPSSLSSPLVSMCLEDKANSSSPIVYAVSDNDLIQFDSRLNSKNKICLMNQYRNKDFTAITSTNSLFAVANKVGEIRIYSYFSKNPKKVISTFNDAITFIDITKDASFIVATCDLCLILIDMKTDEMKSLNITEEDIKAYHLEGCSFVRGRFDNDTSEKRIVAGIGNCSVIWNFEVVRKGKEVYEIKNVGDTIVRDNVFKYRNDDIVTVMDDGLSLLSTH